MGEKFNKIKNTTKEFTNMTASVVDSMYKTGLKGALLGGACGLAITAANVNFPDVVTVVNAFKFVSINLLIGASVGFAGGALSEAGKVAYSKGVKMWNNREKIYSKFKNMFNKNKIKTPII